MATRLRSCKFVLCLGVTSCLSACGDDGPTNVATDGTSSDTASVDSGPLPTDPLDPVALAGEFATAWCGFREQCEPVLATYLPETRAECEARLGAKQRQYLEALVPLIAAGRAGFSRDAFTRCLQAIAAGRQDCARGVEPLACLDYVRGDAPLGAACATDVECTPDAFCDSASLDVCGTCKVRARAGERCETTICAPGLKCLDVGDSARCIPTTADVGAACGEVASGLCRGRLQCVGATTFVCTRPRTLGQSCDVTGSSEADCDIYGGAVCGSDELCVALEVVAPPATCGENAGAHLCNSSSRCDIALSQCVSLPRATESCERVTAACAPGHFCGVDGKCVAEREDGQGCAGSAECAEPLYCIGGTCRPLAFAVCR